MTGPELNGLELNGPIMSCSDWIVVLLVSAWIALREALHRRHRSRNCNEGGQR